MHLCPIVLLLSRSHRFAAVKTDLGLADCADGWFRTGDLGRIDASGNLWLVGRLKDVIRSGSENVAAGEVEKVN